MDWAEQYKSFLKSQFGQEVIRTLEEDLRKGLLDSAQNASDMETAYGFTKEAHGVTLAIGHLQSKAVTFRVKGSKGNKAQ